VTHYPADCGADTRTGRVEGGGESQVRPPCGHEGRADLVCLLHLPEEWRRVGTRTGSVTSPPFYARDNVYFLTPVFFSYSLGGEQGDVTSYHIYELSSSETNGMGM
jgi:hypothetical protein